MKSGKILFTSLLLLLLSVDQAAAVQKGLILLGAFEQSLDLTYQFGRQQVSGGGRSASSSQNRFQEFYNVDTNFAIYNPRLFKARLSAKAKAEQEYLSSSATPSTSTSNLGFLYNFYGILLERGYTPVKFTATSEQTRVDSSFSSGYDLHTDSYGIGAAVRNKIVPVSIDYTRYTSETSGLAEDRIQTNDQVAVSAAHFIPNISTTELLMSRIDSNSRAKGDDEGPSDTQRSFQASLRNALSTPDNKYSLLSNLRIREEVDRGETSNFSWQESFSWRVGRALSLGLGYGNDSTTQKDEVTGESSTRTANSGSFFLSHQLFKNLTTRLDLGVRDSDLVNGSEREYNGVLNINYSRTLPRDGRLTLSYNHLRTLVDRDLTTDRAFALDEPMTARLLDDNLLRQPNVIRESIRVDNASTLVRNIPYVEGVDYIIDETSRAPFTVLVFNIPGSAITEGTSLLIDYSYRVNPSIEYLTVSHSVAGSLFFSGRHRIYASFDTSDQKLISGRSDLLELNDAVGVKVGFTSEIFRIAYGVENSYVDSTLDKHNSTEGYARFSLIYPQSSLMGQLRDRYAIYGRTASNPESRAENSFSATATYTRPVLSSGTLMVNAGFTDSRGGAIVRDDVELGTDFQWGYGQLFLKLTGKVYWRNLAGITSLENYLTFELKRYF